MTAPLFIRVWISSQHAADVASKGFRLVHGPSDFFYLVRLGLLTFVESYIDRQNKTLFKDCGAGEWLGNDINGSVVLVS